MKRSVELKKYKRQMLKKGTPAERLFASRLDREGIAYTRQCIIGFYIVDFVLRQRMIVVELDGSSHCGREAYDARRDGFLESLGFHVVRIQNCDVLSWNFYAFTAYPIRDPKAFSSALGQANSERSRAMQRDRKRA